MRTVCAMNPAVMPIVVGRLAVQTPSRLILASFPSTRARGGMHAKQAVSPGIIIWKWQLRASSETPLSIQIWLSELQRELMVILAV